MRTCTKIRFALAALTLASAAPASAAEDAEAPPAAFEWAFAGDAIGAGFWGTNSWFGESQSFLGVDSDQWFEFGVEPKLSFKGPLGKGTAFGEVSVIGTYTLGDDASGLTAGLNPGGWTLEQAHVGWRVADPFGFMDGETFEAIVGNQDYRIGSGMLILDGGGDGAERGGWYLGMRKAFHEAVMLRVKSEDLLLEAFSIKNHPRQGGTEGQAVGVNGEIAFGDARIGGSLMDVDANLPATDSMSVVSGRFDYAPEKGFGASAEYAVEDSDQVSADGYFAQLSYGTDLPWSPTFSYRYAAFSGDDPATPTVDERFREVAYGYTDYGSWYQGEITGNYPLGNGNLQSNMLRMKASPRDGYTFNVLYYKFTLDQPSALGPGVTSDDWGDELDLALDVELADDLYLIGVLAWLNPGDAAVQWTGGDSPWLYSMIYLSYTW